MVAPNTWRLDKIRLERLRESLAEKRLVQITASDVSSYQLKRLEKVEAATINSETKVLRLILKSAKVWARIADDYAPLRESRRGPGRALLAEQETKLFEIAMGDEKSSAVYHAAILAANTSARGCELRRLRLKDVDLVNGTLTIRRESTKTDAGCRVIPLNASATQAVEHLMKRATLLKCLESEHYLFPGFTFRHTKDKESHKGDGYDPTKHQVSWRTSWRNLTKKAGLPGFRFHDLRHHCITKLAEAGVADQTLMAIAGHVSKAMLDHYSHVRLEARRAAVATLEMPKKPRTTHSEANTAPTSSNEASQ
jgi:integrase